MFDKKAWGEANRDKVKLYSVRARLMSKKDDVAYSLQTLCHPASEFLADGQRLTLFIKRGNEAASEILRLRAENEKLRAALKLIAETYNKSTSSLRQFNKLKVVGFGAM